MTIASLDISNVAVYHAKRTPFKSIQVILWTVSKRESLEE